MSSASAPTFYTPAVAGLLYALGATTIMTAFLVVAWTLLWRHALSKNPLVRELVGLDSPQASPARPHKNKARKDH